MYLFVNNNFTFLGNIKTFFSEKFIIWTPY